MKGKMSHLRFEGNSGEMEGEVVPKERSRERISGDGVDLLISRLAGLTHDSMEGVLQTCTSSSIERGIRGTTVLVDSSSFIFFNTHFSSSFSF